MPFRRGRDLYARTLLDGKQAASRYVDLAVEFVDERDQSPLWRVGGRWDRKGKCWSDEEPRTVLQVRLHPGQLETSDFFAEWFESYLTGDELSEPVYSVLLLGGSRSGKTYMGVALSAAFACAVPSSRIWTVQEVDIERADELETELDEFIPAAWAEKKAGLYKFANGATIKIRSAKYPRKLKRGRCDFALLNEGQNVEELAHSMLRMRTSDTSGIVVTAANPPNDNPDGEWVADFAQECKTGRRKNARTFHYHPHDNPHINREQLAALESETDPRTYAIEVLGEVLPPSNAVMHAFSVVENVDPIPELPGLDITEAFLRKRGLGANAIDFVGLDFQKSPHQAAVLGRAYLNPEDALRPLLYYRGEIIVPLGDEHDLSDGLYEAGLQPISTVLIADASGDWQNAERTEGGASYEILRQHGWKRIHHPDRNSVRNPPLPERFKNDNRLFASQDGQHIVRIDPRCVGLIAACKGWRKNARGLPDRRSKHAHVGDAMSYSNFRLYPRRVTWGKVGYRRIKGRSRPRQMKSF